MVVTLLLSVVEDNNELWETMHNEGRGKNTLFFLDIALIEYHKKDTFLDGLFTLNKFNISVQ